MTVELSGYQIGQCIYTGTRTLVYRGVRSWDNLPVVIKVLRNEYPSFNELLQFRNQYSISKHLKTPGIIQTYSLESYKNSYALVMEDFGGISVQQWHNKAPLSLEDFFPIALPLCDTLELLANQQIIHKDIKPANILINPHTKQVKLIDFSIASRLPKETQTLTNPNVLEGTLAYISPEQTGRMNRGIDYRTDFYSLGVTFYELLTGKLPFECDDPMELVHCHIAKQPPHLSHPQNLPPVLEEIILKLMAKNAEYRYQSAFGLKHDLQQCFEQWKETGTIESFELGQRDLCDRFIIPEKLYGREREVEALLQAFARVARTPEDTRQPTSEMILVAGLSGIGKTAVINEVHKPITRQHGYFIKGKFDQFNRNIPLSAFVQALRDLIGQLLSESDRQLNLWKNRILQAVGDSGQVLIEVIPELEKIIDKQPSVEELSGVAAQNRFNLLFQKFIEVFATVEHPLVLFLDDLQWADLASLQFLKLLMDGCDYLLVLGAYRDNEVSPTHPLMLAIEELLKADKTVSTITLKPLSFDHTNRLVAETLNCGTELAKPLSELIDRKTQGNPFFTTQFLKSLHDEGYIRFDGARGYWECDISQVNALAVTDDVVEFMAVQLQKLPQPTQEVLKLAACIGNQFDLETLAIVSQQTCHQVAIALWEALQEGLAMPTSRVYKFFQSDEMDKAGDENLVNPTYRFLHDRVQQAAYSLIPDEQKPVTHLKMGRRLQLNLSAAEKEEHLFDLVNHLNLGIELISEAAEREALAQLNLAAGQKAQNATAYAAARSFVQTGMELLAADCWQSQYELTLNLFVAAAETAYLNADFESMEATAARVLSAARTVLDKVKIYEIQINALTAQSQMLEAISVGQNALTQLGVEFSCEPDEALTGKALKTVVERLGDKPIEELVNLPVMSDPQAIAAMQLLAMLFAPIFGASPAVLPRVGATMVSLSLEFGNTPASTIGYGSYGMVLAAFLGEVEKGYRFGRVALSLLDRFNVRQFKSLTLLWFGGFLQHRKESLRATIPTLKDGYLAGMETGNFLDAGYNIINYFFDRFFGGVYLGDWEEELENYCVVLATVKQSSPLAYLKMTQQTAQNLMEIGDRPDLLIGAACDERLMIPTFLKNQELTGLAFVYIYKLMLAHLFGNYTNALEYIEQANLFLRAATGKVHTPVFHFYAGLTYLASCSTHSETQSLDTLAVVEKHQTSLSQWAYHAPMNHQHKVDLIEAEKFRVLGNKTEAIEAYDRAIAGAKTNEFIQEEALANELAAKFYLDWGKEKVAQAYLQDAYYCYAKWGAKAKTDDLEKRYPDLLKPILQSAASSLNSLDTLATITTTSSTLYKSTQKTHPSNTSLNTALDLASIIKASQVLSSTIQLDELLSQLTQIILQHSGGDRCALVVPALEGEWQVRAIATAQTHELCTQPLTGDSDVPVKLLHYVKNTQEMALIDALETDLPVMDDYLSEHQPQSVLCFPIINRGNPSGLLYLENRSTRGVFTHERLVILNFLCTQAAISLENARLYQQAQQALQDLKNAQLQIVQSEKMSALGNLVAGVAHEINNPVGFISGNLTEAISAVRDLKDYIEFYHEKCPIDSEEVVEKAEDIELEYLLEDLPKMLKSMQVGCDRIKGISTSLRTFSRADKDYKVPFNLHDGLDSTLLILKHRLKANENRPAIEVVKNYGCLPEVECFPGQLNQVFMNILANAIDAVDESNTGRSFAQIQAHPNRIEIHTEVKGNAIAVRIVDNGLGMPQDVKERIFEQGFTTKAVGKGTGLGLAIARQIIVEKHGGAIEVSSTPGQGTELAIALDCPSSRPK